MRSLANLQELVERGATTAVNFVLTGDSLEAWPLEYFWTDGQKCRYLKFADNMWEREHGHRLASLACVDPVDQEWRAVRDDGMMTFVIEPLVDDKKRRIVDTLIVEHRKTYNYPDGVWLYHGPTDVVGDGPRSGGG